MPFKLTRIFTIDSNQLIVSHLLNNELLLGRPEPFLPSLLSIFELLVRVGLLHTLSAQKCKSFFVPLLRKQIAREFVLFRWGHQRLIVFEHSQVFDIGLAIASSHFLCIEVA